MRALDEVFLFGFIREPATLFSGIHRLSPGHWLLYENGNVVIRPYWSLVDMLGREPDAEGRADEWALRLRTTLEKVVALHLRGDVRVGAWLSGMSRLQRDHRARLSGWPGRSPKSPSPSTPPDLDETRGQMLLDEVPGRELPNERVPCDASALERFPEAMWHGRCRRPPRRISRACFWPRRGAPGPGRPHRRGCGRGVGGYVWHRADRLLHWAGALPCGCGTSSSSDRWAGTRWPWSSRIVLAPRAIDLPRYSRFVGPLGGEDRRALFSPDIRAELDASGAEDGEPVSDPATPRCRFAALQYHDLRTRLAGT